MPVPTYTKAGTKASTPAKLSKDVFGLDVDNHELIKQAYVTHMGNARLNLAVTKTRGLVRGGGRKPWAQKGTGRARFGSSRNPIWRGGGIVFGPTGEENYSKKLSSKATRKAIRQSLSLAAKENQIIVIDSVEPKDGKTAELAKLLTKINTPRNVLIISDVKTDELLRASSNLQNVTLATSKYLNVRDILDSDHIVFSKSALDITTKWLEEAK